MKRCLTSAPLRNELLRGVLGSLYIGWLPAVAGKMMDDDDLEPLSVSGLASLTAARQSLAEFLEVDHSLLARAGIGSQAGPKDLTCRVLVDIVEAHFLFAPNKELNKFIADHQHGKALIQSLLKTGIWKEE